MEQPAAPTMRVLSEVATELKRGVRSVAARPGFSAFVALVLAAGLACVLYVAAMVNGLVLRPLPFHEPDRLYGAGLIDNDDPLDTDSYDLVDVDEFLDWRRYLEGKADIAGYGVATVNLSDAERPERYSGAVVSANLMSVLGVAPRLGRAFDARDEAAGAARAVILSDELWRSRYLSDPQIVGRTVRVNAGPATVVGVMPPDFSFPAYEQVWLAATLARGAPGEQEFSVVLRPRAGAGERELRAAFDAWFADASRADPERMRSRARAVAFEPLAYRFIDRDTRALLGLMLASVVLVLLIACSNVANMMLTQITSRQQELAMRVALGASRRRLALQLMAQTGVLALAAALIALPAAQLLVRATLAMFRQSEDGPPHWMSFDLDGTVIAIAVVAALVTGLLAGWLPALRAGANTELALRDGTRGIGAGGFARASRWLVTGQIALSCALLIAAATMVQAVLRLDRYDLGLRTDHVLTARMALFESRFPADADVLAQVDRLMQRLRAEPEVVDATIGSSLPGLQGDSIDVLELGLPMPAGGLDNPGYTAVDPRFAQAMGATLVAGRFLDEHDAASGERAIVVDQTFVERYVRDGEAVGKRFRLEPGSGDERQATIVGVIRPVQMEDIDDPREPAVFESFRLVPSRYFSIFVRTRGEPMAFAARLRAIAAEVDADTPVYWVRSYEDVLRQATFGQRVLARVFGGFGLVALLLASAGLYGVVAFSVGQRTREIGVRRALGATGLTVLGTVVGRSGLQVGAGLALGVLLGVPFAGMLAGPLGDIVGVDAVTSLAVVAVLSVVAALAIWVPARRALRVDPMAALRHD